MASIEKAVSDRVVARGFVELNDYVWNSDIIFICTPVKLSLEYIGMLSGKVGQNCIVTDVCSTKGEIIGYVNSIQGSFCFVGGHPMAGTEKSGYSASLPHLFENAYYVLTPSASTSESCIDFMSALTGRIGAIPIQLGADEHDRITGGISHVPHVVASALVNLVRGMDNSDTAQLLAAGGFKDITRIASSNPSMWENIVRSNKYHVKKLLEDYIVILDKFISALDKDDYLSIHGYFETAKIYRDSFVSNNKKGLIPPLSEIIVDVVDKPGIIAEIATILGANGVNIKNINVSNSREFEQGCLRITLSDAESMRKAFDLLQCTGHKVYKN